MQAWQTYRDLDDDVGGSARRRRSGVRQDPGPQTPRNVDRADGGTVHDARCMSGHAAEAAPR